MGIAKKTDGRYVVGVGVDNANDYKGSAAYRDIYIQLTSSGATAKSEEYLTFLKDYGFHANSLGEPIMPPSVNVWISNNGVTTAVEADDVSIDGSNYTICGIKWNGSTWDFSGAGQGKSGSGLPSYTSADKGKVLTIGEASPVETEVVVVPEQTVTYEGDAVLLSNAEGVASLNDGTSVVLFVNGQRYEAALSNYDIRVEFETSKFYHVYNGKGTTVYFEAYDTAVPGHEGDVTPIIGTYTVSLSAVQSVTPSVTTVIVPEQSVTTAYSSYTTKYMAPVEIDDVSQPSADYTYTMTINGTDYPVVITGWQYWTSDHEYVIAPNIPDTTSWSFVASNAEAAGTYTVSLTASVPSVEPKWETAGCVINVSGKPGSTLTPDKTYSEVVKAINKGIMPVAVLGGGSIILPYSGKKPGDILTFQFIGANTSVGGTIDGLTCVIGGYSEADGFTVAQFTVSF